VLDPGKTYEIDTALEAGVGRVIFVGELDIASAPELEASALAMVRDEVRELRIDLSKLSFIDSSGLRALIALGDAAAADGWKLALTRPAGEVLPIFALTGADEHLPFVEDARP
jgi:anti-sigma B factor antagonist